VDESGLKGPIYEVVYDVVSRAVAPFRSRVKAFRDDVRVRPGIVLTRHFFNRLFQNDVFPFEEQMKEKLYVLLAMVAALGWALAISLFSKYMFVEDNGSSWLEKCHFLIFFMLFLGLATVLEWDALFLDRRDYTNLMPLPVRLRTVFLAKFASFFVFVLFLSVAVNSLSLMAPAFFLVRWISNSLSALGIYFLAQIAAVTASFAFTFFAFVFLVSVLLLVLGPRAFKTVSLFIRFGILAACVFLLMMFLGGTAESFFVNLTVLKSRSDPAVLAFPPFWFTGLYEVIIGRGNPLYETAALYGLGATLALMTGSFLAMALGYRKHVSRTLEVRVTSVVLKKIRRLVEDGFNAVVLRNPVERAVFHFFGKTIARSNLHKVRLAGTLAFGFGLIFILFGIQRNALSRLNVSNLSLLGAPLLLSFFLLGGLRSLVNVPIAADANWIFQLTEAENRKLYFIALKKAIFFFAILPMFALLTIFYALIWGGGPALLHGLYGLTFALALRDILFWKYGKIPFACLVVPGKAKLHMYWLPYVLASALSVSGFSALEKSLFLAPSGFFGFFAISWGILFAVSFVERRWVLGKLEIAYVEEPEPAMISLA
jgi:hypothetical protein